MEQTISRKDDAISNTFICCFYISNNVISLTAMVHQGRYLRGARTSGADVCILLLTSLLGITSDVTTWMPVRPAIVTRHIYVTGITGRSNGTSSIIGCHQSIMLWIKESPEVKLISRNKFDQPAVYKVCNGY